MNSPQIDEAALKKAVQAYLDCKSLSYKMSNAQTQKVEAAITAYLSATKAIQSDNDYCEAGCFNPACSCNIQEKSKTLEE